MDENVKKKYYNCGTFYCASESDTNSVEFIKDLSEEKIKDLLGYINPISHADLRKGEIVLDLGCGGGIGTLIAARLVEEIGKAYGLATEDGMIELANSYKEKSGIKNVEFLKGYFEEIPLNDESVDVITSNSMITLCANEKDALKEAYRVLKKGGRLVISGIFTSDIESKTEIWIGPVTKTLTTKKYKEFLEDAGFTNIEITPVNLYTEVYTEEALKAMAEIDLSKVDKTFDASIIKVYK